MGKRPLALSKRARIEQLRTLEDRGTRGPQWYLEPYLLRSFSSVA